MRARHPASRLGCEDRLASAQRITRDPRQLLAVQLANSKLLHVQPVSPDVHAEPSDVVQSMPVYVAVQSVRARQSVASLISAHAGGTSHELIASQLPVQQAFEMVGTWPLGHVGCAVVQVTVPPQLVFGAVPGSHVERLVLQ
jgi:hypothetical protein